MWNKSVVYKIVVGILVLVIGVGALGLSAFAEDTVPTPTPTPTSEIENTEENTDNTISSPTATPEATATPDSNENVDNNVNNDEKTGENLDEKAEIEEVNEEEKNEENQIMMAGTMQNITIDPNGGTYKGNSSKTSEEVASGTAYELNEIPVRPGYTFQGWKLSGGVLKSGQSTGVIGELGGNKNNPPKIVETIRADSNGAPYTNYSLNYKNDSNGYDAWPNFQLLTYSYELNHTYQIELDIRVNISTSGFSHLHLRHAACLNDYASSKTIAINEALGWEHKTRTRTFDSETLEHSGRTEKVAPTIECYSYLPPGNTGVFDFDVKNVTVYDVTAQKYVTSNDPNVKAGTTVEITDTDATVTAVWEPKIDVKFHRNISSSDTTVTNKAYTYDVFGQAFSDCGYTYTNPGYTLAGWAFKADATEPDYTVTNGIANIWIENYYPSTDLYAVWKPKTGTLTYSVEGGGTVSRTTETVSGNNSALGSTATARAGYHFDGWYNDYGEKVSADATIKPGTPTAFNGLGGNYYSSYDFKCDASSGVSSVIIDVNKMNSSWGSGFQISRSDDIPYGKWYICSFEIYSPVDAYIQIDLNNYPVSGSTWSTSGNDNDSGELRHEGSKFISANTWTTITFGYKNGRTENTNKIALYDVSGIGVKYDTSKGDQTIKIRNIQSMVADSYAGSASKYIAKFSRNTYTIKYDGNGADSGTMENTVHEYHENGGETGSVTLRKNAFQKTGYAFKGWYLSRKNGSNLEYFYRHGWDSVWNWYQEDKQPAGYQKYLYGDGEGSSNATTVDGEVLTAVAQWEKLTDITIINTVSGNMGNKSKDFTYAIQLPSSFNGTQLTVVDASGNTSTVTVGSDCKLSFTLKHGQSYTIKELNEAQFNSIKGLTNYGISETSYAEEGYKTSSTTKMDAHGNIQLIFNNQNGSVLPTGIILGGSGMGIIVALVIALGWLIKHKFIK